MRQIPELGVEEGAPDVGPRSGSISAMWGWRSRTAILMERSYIRITAPNSHRGPSRAGLSDSGLVPSMGSIGDCVDNAVIESFCARMQVELLDRQRWLSRVELANAIFEYLEIFHNRKRRHSALGMRTPVEYEMMNRHQTQVA